MKKSPQDETYNFTEEEAEAIVNSAHKILPVLNIKGAEHLAMTMNCLSAIISQLTYIYIKQEFHKDTVKHVAKMIMSNLQGLNLAEGERKEKDDETC